MSARPIAIFAAMDAEVRPLVRRLGLRPLSAWTGPRGHHGEVDGRPVTVTLTGVGRDRAAARAEAALDAMRPAEVLVVGFAGGAAPSLRPADVIVPDRVLDAASGTVHRPTLGGEATATLKTIEAPLLDKAALYQRERVDAVDMETAAVAAACERRAIPWLAIRAVSDPADRPLPPFVADLVGPDGKPRLGRAARRVLRRPTRMLPLLRLARDGRHAARTLASTTAARLAEVDARSAWGRWRAAP